MKKLYLLSLFFLLPLIVFSEEAVSIDGVCYVLISKAKIAEVTYDILIEQARKEKQVDLNYVKNIEMLLDRIKQEFYKKAEECKTKNDEKGDLYYNEFAQGIDLDNIIEPKIWEELTGIKDVQVKDFDRKKILEKEEDNVLPVKVEKKRTI